jgi:hydrogenase maturation protease
MEKKSKILIVGVGNTIRGDDGIGTFICNSIERLELDGVKTMAVQQLHTEMVEEFLSFDHIVIADAAVTGEPVLFYPLKREGSAPVSTSHHVNANLLASLSDRLYKKELPMMLCAVRGENFEIGEHLSAIAKQNADLAISIISDWIKNDCR